MLGDAEGILLLGLLLSPDKGCALGDSKGLLLGLLLSELDGLLLLRMQNLEANVEIFVGKSEIKHEY